MVLNYHRCRALSTRCSITSGRQTSDLPVDRYECYLGYSYELIVTHGVIQTMKFGVFKPKSSPGSL